MTDEHAQPGGLSRLLARLLARLRRAEPKRPRWWHFAPHALLAVALAALQFFYTSLRNSGQLRHLDLTVWTLLVVLPLLLIPVSLLHALWRCFRSRSLRGAVWLLRPALLCLALFALVSPLHQWGKRWDFERHLSERNEAVRLILSTHHEPLPEGKALVVELPEGFRHLSHGGKVVLEGAYEATVISFGLIDGNYEYYTGESKWRTPAYGWYDGHWCLSPR